MASPPPPPGARRRRLLVGPDCRQPGKHPRTPSGFHATTTNPDRMRAWWASWPQANIGVTTGTSGLVVVDLDGPQGLATWRALTAEHGPGPATATVATPAATSRTTANPLPAVLSPQAWLRRRACGCSTQICSDP
ncbi:MAG: hypothetical protein GEU81_14120 [Nitriliruptorales bacterium]|nr:hypothetical protein [Nitriliruptorales bacterium]